MEIQCESCDKKMAYSYPEKLYECPSCKTKISMNFSPLQNQGLIQIEDLSIVVRAMCPAKGKYEDGRIFNCVQARGHEDEHYAVIKPGFNMVWNDGSSLDALTNRD